VFSWWDLGEGIGYSGTQLELFRIECPFCLEKGNFAVDHQASKRKPNTGKVLHFDTLKCVNCGGYVMVLWSAGEFASPLSGLYSYRVLPWPLETTSFPDHWPQNIGRYWLQAHRSVQQENWDAAAVMARSAMQLALREHGATGRTLAQEVESLANTGVLPPLMKEWSHEVRELGNESAHPGVSQDPTEPADAKDIVEYLDFMLGYLYTLPHQIQQYRSRRT